MSITIGLVANIFQESNALPGWLETHTPFFDDIRVLHAGPGRAYSDDGTIEILEKWRIPTEFCSINLGFGAVRTKALRLSKCDYIMLLDADERFYHLHKLLVCEGTHTSIEESDRILRGYHYRDGHTPDWSEIRKLGSGLKVRLDEVYDQGQHLRDILKYHECTLKRPIDVVSTIRRHWHDLSFLRPTQSWVIQPDWQMRLVRNDPTISFDISTKMHERLVGATNISYSDGCYGPFFDHFHFHFKRMEQEQRAHDVETYDRILREG